MILDRASDWLPVFPERASGVTWFPRGKISSPCTTRRRMETVGNAARPCKRQKGVERQKLKCRSAVPGQSGFFPKFVQDSREISRSEGESASTDDRSIVPGLPL